jgi:GDPmannose 4,6-dehydratase
VRDFCRVAFAHAGLHYERHIQVDESLLRRADHSGALGNAAKAKRVLGWSAGTSLEALVGMMVDADLARLDRGEIP